MYLFLQMNVCLMKVLANSSTPTSSEKKTGAEQASTERRIATTKHTIIHLRLKPNQTKYSQKR